MARVLPLELVLEVLSCLINDDDLTAVEVAVPAWIHAVRTVRFRYPALDLISRVPQKQRQFFANQIRVIDLHTNRDGVSLRAFENLHLPSVHTLRLELPRSKRYWEAPPNIVGIAHRYENKVARTRPRCWKENTFATLRRCTNLKRIEIHAWPFKGVDALDFVRQCRHLKHFTTSEWGFNSANEESKTHVFEVLRITSITSLYMDINLSQADSSTLLAGFPNDFDHVTAFRCEGDLNHQLAAFIAKFINAERLEMEVINYISSPLAQIFSRFENLKHLSIIFRGGRSAAVLPSFKHFWQAESIFRLSRLQIICPREYRFVDLAHHRFFDYGGIFPNMIDLRLRADGITGTDLSILAVCFPNLKALVVGGDELCIHSMDVIGAPRLLHLTRLGLATVVPSTEQTNQLAKCKTKTARRAMMLEFATKVAQILVTFAPRLVETHEFMTYGDEYGRFVYRAFNDTVRGPARLFRYKRSTDPDDYGEGSDRFGHWVDANIFANDW